MDYSGHTSLILHNIQSARGCHKKSHELQQVFRVWFEKLIVFRIDNDYVRWGENEKTLVLKHIRSDFIIAHIYYDDSSHNLVEQFLEQGENEFIMSIMGEIRASTRVSIDLGLEQSIQSLGVVMRRLSC